MKIQIKSILEDVLFEHDEEKNSIKKTLELAVRSGADLRSADLRSADLAGANLRGIVNIDTAWLPIFCKWGVSVKADILKIGCKEKTFDEWDKWFASDEEFETPRSSSEFTQIQAMYLAYKTYYEVLSN